MQFLTRLDSRLSEFEMIAAGALLLFMSVIAFVQVITRYCFFYSLVWSEEITRYCMIWMTFIGAAYAVSKQEHINIDLLSDFFKRHGIRIGLILNVLMLVFLIACVCYGTGLTVSTFEANQLTPAIGFPMFIVYALVVAALVLAAFHAFVRIACALSPREEK
ncbi:MAG: TRAP transporter small permease [Succinivibrio sp.]